MLRSDRAMIVVVLLLMPVLLCFIGAGAFLHVVVRADAEQEEQAREKIEHTIDAEEARAKHLKAAMEQREREIEEIRKRLAELEKAKACQAELARLQELKDRLEKERQALLSELEALKACSDSKSTECESLRRQETEARGKLQKVERQIAELERKIAQMTPSATPGGKPPENGPSLAELKASIAQLTATLQEKQRKLEQAESQNDALGPERDGPKIRIATIRGSVAWQPPPNPLYAECDGQGILLQPENVRPQLQPGQTTEEQFLQAARQRGYVLFLIRPDGFGAFRRYRNTIVQNNIDFGYEPIPQDAWVDY